ncbi:hypothetical protein DFQ26_005272 [Actinomortierella ambigua]|nr:hypothetical protein DFQ26_005272 [Actinomortierella ambigua]
MTKSILLMATVAAVASAQALTLNHISFTQPVGDGISYVAGTNQTMSWNVPCTPPSTLTSATPNATEVDFMDSNNINNAFYVKKVGTIDCTKNVGNLVWTVPADTKPGIYALQLLLTPNNAYSGRFNVTGPGGSTGGSSPGTGSGSGSGTGETGGSQPPANAPSTGAAGLAATKLPASYWSLAAAASAGAAALASLLA